MYSYLWLPNLMRMLLWLKKLMRQLIKWGNNKCMARLLTATKFLTIIYRAWLLA